MSSVKRVLGLVSGVAVLGCLLACGSIQKAAQNSKTVNDLKQFGLAYHSYFETFKKGPSGPNDLVPYLEGNQALANQAGPGGKYVLVWDVKLSDLLKSPVGTGNIVLGYESTVPTAGGPVLFADASVRQVTAAEFGALTKATPSKK